MNAAGCSEDNFPWKRKWAWLRRDSGCTFNYRLSTKLWCPKTFALTYLNRDGQIDFLPIWTFRWEIILLYNEKNLFTRIFIAEKFYFAKTLFHRWRSKNCEIFLGFLFRQTLLWFIDSSWEAHRSITLSLLLSIWLFFSLSLRKKPRRNIFWYRINEGWANK